jgi:uncharacterized membrane protein YbhN (UPF0104 family)
VSKRRLRIGLTIGLSVIVLLAFVYYISKHEYILRQLRHTPISLIIWLILLYAVWFAALMFIITASIRLCKKKLELKENFLLNAYSTLFNFFVPGQGGIAIRGIYLKKKKNLLIKKFIFVSLLYYSFYAVISILFALSGNQPLWKKFLATLLVLVVCLLVMLLFTRNTKIKQWGLNFSASNLLMLVLATLFQSVVQAVIFGIELHSVNQNIALHQIIAYTGVANFAVFAALTPGAIGIRESFLVIGHNLHGISNANTIAANIIDRGVFIVFLVILFLVTLAFHARSNMFVDKEVQEQNEIRHDNINSSANEQ